MSSNIAAGAIKLHNVNEGTQARQAWMSLLARADVAVLEKAWADMDDKPEYSVLRAPETGMVMVRARAGGEGQRFNFGEMTVTRCVVNTHAGVQGYAYVAGRSKRHATLAAVLDAMMQSPASREQVEQNVLTPIRAKLRSQRDETARKVAATKVDFFTMVRGDD